MMNALTGGYFLFLALIINSSCAQNYFTLEDKILTATEGSCAEIKCVVGYDPRVSPDAYWFWIKDAKWKDSYFDGTVIYSSHPSKRPLSKDLADRVTYVGSPSSSWSHISTSTRRCSIMICNLSRADSGDYIFRFINPDFKWATPALNLTVAENPCLIAFGDVPTAKEGDTVKLTCSTPKSCPSDLRIDGPQTQMLSSGPQQSVGNRKIATYSFNAEWEQDGKTFSCQTQENKDVYLIQNISVTIEYAPKDPVAKKSTENIRKGQSVTFTCTSKGRPDPTIVWLKNSTQVSVGATWTIPSINSSHDGQYYCEAHNKHGTVKSAPVNVDVQYPPEVVVKMTTPARVLQGDQIILTCDVIRSNPSPHTYSWWRDESQIHSYNSAKFAKYMEPEDTGLYSCGATNSVGTTRSEKTAISVLYKPGRASISNQDAREVPVGDTLNFECNADANPSPSEYSWYRYNKIFTKSYTTKVNKLQLNRIERTDEACYMCNATNTYGTGETSPQICIKVLYGPTNLRLSMESHDVTEGDITTINCTVDSYPASKLTLKKPDGTTEDVVKSNLLTYRFEVKPTHAGVYNCGATNSQGLANNESKLVVRYRPTDVKVHAEPTSTVNENASLELRCTAKAFPPVTSYTWTKKNDAGRKERILAKEILSVKSVSLTDRGVYSCAATNDIGTGHSQPQEVKVKYAPKQTNITRVAEQKHPEGKSSVTLRCSSDGYPEVTDYSWYRKTKDREEEVRVSGGQNINVFSDQPGHYYCVAKNEINQRSSEAVPVFVDHGFVIVLKVFFLILLTLLVASIFIFCRRKRNKSIQQANSSGASPFGALCRRNLTSAAITSEPFRSRDDLLPEQLRRPEAQRHQPCPDSTPASSMVYSTVNHPAAGQGASAQKPLAQQHGHARDESLNYASLDFGKKQTNKPAAATEEATYAVVSKPKPTEKEQKNLPDYENVSPSNPQSYDSDTSEDEVELNYSQVSFKAKPRPKKHDSDTSSETSSETSSDSSTSDGEEAVYSAVKV